ncbi:MAG TPA: hemin receptor, partial [Kiloniellaceae bacterium]|nr:hemin receptor [Kiloniellaceae bacterium]
LFYNRLFEIDPAAEQLFAGTDMALQRQKLLQTLNAAIGGLDNLEGLAPVLQDLGRRHADYGVSDSHYDSVGAALLWALEQGLGDDWTPEAKEAWTTAYGLIAETMRAAADQQAARASAQ